MKPAASPNIIDDTNIAVANLLPKNAVSNIYSEGLVSGEDIRNAITGPQGIAETNIDKSTAIVPQAHSGVSAPNATAPGIEIPVF
jgi:hypothetical protein